MVRIADVDIGINSLFNEVDLIWREYRIYKANSIMFEVETSWEEMEDEKTIFYQAHAGKDFSAYNLETYIEALLIYRKICEKLLMYNILLMHGSVIGINSNNNDVSAYMFTAPSGTGKSTLLRTWAMQIAESFFLNGDKPLIKIENKNVYVYGTPFKGKENYGWNRRAYLKAICILERAEENSIREISLLEAFPILLQQTYYADHIDNRKKTISLLKELGGNLKLYKMKINNFAPDAFDVSYNALVLGKAWYC